MCLGEDCYIENINDGGGENNLMNGYCFLDEGYSGEKPFGPNNSTQRIKVDLTNNAYEQMMKSRGAI